MQDSERFIQLREDIKNDFQEVLARHVSPCPALKEILDEKEKRSAMWDSIKGGLITYVSAAIIISAMSLMIWALVHGAPIAINGP